MAKSMLQEMQGKVRISEWLIKPLGSIVESLTYFQSLSTAMDLLTDMQFRSPYKNKEGACKLADSKISTNDSITQFIDKELVESLTKCYNKLLWCYISNISKNKVNIVFLNYIKLRVIGKKPVI